MRANVAVKVIDRKTAKPLKGAAVTLGTSMYSLDQVTDSWGSTSFVVDVGGDEVGRHPIEGITVDIWARKPGYVTFSDRFMCYGNRALIAQMERT